MRGETAIRVGGQALVDGVLMRSDRVWALARADGSVEVGELAPRRFPRVPGVRVLAGIVGGFRLAFTRPGRRRTDRRLLWSLLGVEAVVVAISWRLGDVAAPVWASTALSFATLVGLRLATPRSLWRYHGAEHKAVAAYEAGIDLDDVRAVLACPRVHNRCGTNLVVVMLLAGALLTDVGPVLQVPAFLALLALSAELVSLAAKRPRFLLSRVVLVGGRAVQRWVTTAEPTAAEQVVGCRALVAVLSAHEVDVVPLAA
jgi:uncharacterized protein YqhQ